MDGPTRAARRAAIDAPLPGEALLEAITSYSARITQARAEVKALSRDNEVLEAQLQTTRKALSQAMETREHLLHERQTLVSQLASYISVLERLCEEDEDTVEAAIGEGRALLAEARRRA